MNYIEELNAFRDYLMINRLATGQIALWYALMQINNMTGWSEWFTSANPTLQLMTGLSRQGLDKARNQIVQLGLIEYKPGTTRQAGKYKIHSLTNSITSNSRLISSQIVDKSASNQESNSRLISSTLNKLNKTKQNSSSNNAREDENIFSCYQNNIGPITSEIEAQRIIDLTERYPELWITKAIEIAVTNQARKLSYIEAILKRWQVNGTDTPWEATKGERTRKYQSRPFSCGKPGQKSTAASGTDWDNEPDTLGG